MKPMNEKLIKPIKHRIHAHDVCSICQMILWLSLENGSVFEIVPINSNILFLYGTSRSSWAVVSCCINYCSGIGVKIVLTGMYDNLRCSLKIKTSIDWLVRRKDLKIYLKPRYMYQYSKNNFFNDGQSIDIYFSWLTCS